MIKHESLFFFLSTLENVTRGKCHVLWGLFESLKMKNIGIHCNYTFSSAAFVLNNQNSGELHNDHLSVKSVVVALHCKKCASLYNDTAL